MLTALGLWRRENDEPSILIMTTEQATQHFYQVVGGFAPETPKSGLYPLLVISMERHSQHSGFYLKSTGNWS